MHGEFIGIECKAGNNKPTVIQERNLAAIEESGGIALVINEDSLDVLRDVLSELMEAHISRNKLSSLLGINA
jgi:hypothetical protein